MKKLVVLEPLNVSEEEFRTIIKERLPEEVDLIYYTERAQSADEMAERAKDAEIVIIADQPMPKEALAKMEKIELLAVAFTGFDHIPLDEARERGITVCNASGYSNEAVTDLVFGMVITLLRNLRECDKVVRDGGTKEGLIGQELSALTFGVIGAGAIGKQVLKVAHAFGCKCQFYNRSEKHIEGATQVDLDTLLKTSDVISVHLPVNDGTRGFVDKEAFSKMKETALFVNCARGPIVDIDALAEALHANRLGGAAIDVFYTEPPLEKNHPLFSTPKTLLTPHVAFATDEAFVKRAKIVADNIKAFLSGTPQNVVS